MGTSQVWDHTRSKASYRVDLLLALLLFLAGLGIRWRFARAIVFPPSDEAAFYLTTAENLLTGRGLEVDVLWSYQIPFPHVTHPSHEEWMPLTTGLVAIAFWVQRTLSGVLNTSLLIAQIPGIIVGALLAPLTYIFGRRCLPGDGGSLFSSWRGSRWVSLGAGLLVALNSALIYQSASVDSSAPLVLFTAWALAIAVRRPGDQGGYFGAGLLVALACLTHAEGYLVLITIPLAWWLFPTQTRPLSALQDNVQSHPGAGSVQEQRHREAGSEVEWQRALGPSMVHVLDLGVAFALVVSPWLVRHYLAFGTPLPGPVLSQFWLSNPTDAFNYLSPPTPQTWLAQGWQVLLQQRVQALLYNSQALLAHTFPWGLLALPGLWLLRREGSFFPSLMYGMLLFFGVGLILPISSMSGAFDRSLGTLMPLLALAALYTLQRMVLYMHRLRKPAEIAAAVLAAALVALAGKEVSLALPDATAQSQARQAEFERARDWLSQYAAPDDTIMTGQTYTLNYTSRQPCIALPGNEPPDAAWAAAQLYGARFLLVTETFGNYPQILEDQPDPRFHVVEQMETAILYEIRGN